MRSLSGNFDVSPATVRLASPPADGQPVDTARLLEIFWEKFARFWTRLVAPVPRDEPYGNSRNSREDNDERLAS
jgi:hypothetical protein